LGALVAAELAADEPLLAADEALLAGALVAAELAADEPLLAGALVAAELAGALLAAELAAGDDALFDSDEESLKLKLELVKLAIDV